MGRKWVYKPGHPKANERGFVAWEDYGGGPEPMALHAPVLVDRFYEGTVATDGTDIGSRRKHRDYMKANNLTMADDFSPAWREEQRKAKEREDKRDRREAVGRAIYNIWDKR